MTKIRKFKNFEEYYALVRGNQDEFVPQKASEGKKEEVKKPAKDKKDKEDDKVQAK